VAGIFIFLIWKLPSLKNAGVVVSPLTLVLLGYGIMKSDPAIAPLPPPYQSYWLWIHVTLAWVAYGAYHVAAGTAILYLLKKNKAGDEKFFLSGLLKKLPEEDRMDELVYKLIIYGFIAHIGMLGSGSIWAYGLWGRYWGWDPIETWSLISWLVYGVNIHLRATYHWKGRKAAWLAISSLAGIIITFGGIGFIRGVHTTLL
jgi:cytochrome c-type biogenesis protein CcsB